MGVRFRSSRPEAGTADILRIREAAARHGVEPFGPPWLDDAPQFVASAT